VRRAHHPCLGVAYSLYLNAITRARLRSDDHILLLGPASQNAHSGKEGNEQMNRQIDTAFLAALAAAALLPVAAARC